MPDNRGASPIFCASSLESKIIDILQVQPALEFAVLIGSRANDSATVESDWDIALQWSAQLNWLDRLGHTETLRRQLAANIGVSETAIDLIDLPRANLAMRAAVAEEGKPLKGQDSLAWAHFLRRTWREMEDFYWEKQHAA
ncbi:hypothetical protein MASR1M60_07560 [Rhodocyclaceae bacterium]